MDGWVGGWVGERRTSSTAVTKVFGGWVGGWVGGWEDVPAARQALRYWVKYFHAVLA